jgi:hypothetical protein
MPRHAGTKIATASTDRLTQVGVPTNARGKSWCKPCMSENVGI